MRKGDKCARSKNSRDALWVLRNVEDAKLLFVETPLPTDDLDGLACLADGTATPVAVGEFRQTRHEFRELWVQCYLPEFEKAPTGATSNTRRAPSEIIPAVPGLSHMIRNRT